LNASSEADFDAVFAKLHALGVSALMIAQDAFFNGQSARLAALSIDHAMPAVYSYRDFTDAGGLMSYGTNELDAYRQVGIYVARILKARSPPIYRSFKQANSSCVLT
jgi:putative tryptophan/tyrosine transport system substrate-binding protein